MEDNILNSLICSYLRPKYYSSKKMINFRKYQQATFVLIFSILPNLENSVVAEHHSNKPNIVFILADDLGYGDVGCYNSESKIPTPNIDLLAKEGIMFTDAHSPSTVCTPTRYSFLTGRMAFRNGMKGVFTGAGGPCLIENDRLTIAKMLKEQSYITAMFGKWHVGLTFYDTDGKPILKNGLDAVKRIDYTKAITDGPLHQGFDYFFGTASCPTTDWLYAYIDGDKIPTPPTHIVDRTPLPKHPYSRDNRPGMIAPGFDLEEVDMVFLQKSIEFLENHKKNSSNKPFFLFHSAQAVHLPSFPGRAFKGSTQSGPHGDFIFELDFIVGALVKKIDQLGFGENTLIIFTSDNGPEVPTSIDMRKKYNHDGARPWRGVKRDQWEGGHRVPFVVRWPKKIKAGRVSSQTICLTDIMATCATLSGAKLPNNAAEDSFDILPALLKTTKKPIREYTLHQTISLDLAIRNGKWKFLDHKGSGGNNYEREGEWGMKQFALAEHTPESPGQLYNLEKDPGEIKNLYNNYPEIVKKLKSKLEAYKKRDTAD